MLTKAADQMSEEDYAFKPTPEVRSLGQLLAHVADASYMFCSLAKGEKRPVEGIERTKTTRADIKKALSESFSHCDEAYAALTDAKAKTMIEFRGKPRPILAVLHVPEPPQPVALRQRHHIHAAQREGAALDGRRTTMTSRTAETAPQNYAKAIPR